MNTPNFPSEKQEIPNDPISKILFFEPCVLALENLHGKSYSYLLKTILTTEDTEVIYMLENLRQDIESEGLLEFSKDLAEKKRQRVCELKGVESMDDRTYVETTYGKFFENTGPSEINEEEREKIKKALGPTFDIEEWDPDLTYNEWC